MVVNILIMIHGMIPSAETKTHLEDYKIFWQKLEKTEPSLRNLFESDFSHPDSNQKFSFIGVEWGHEPERQGTKLRNDQKLTDAQNFVNEQVSYNNLLKIPEDNNVTLKPFDSPGFLLGLTRGLLINLRESIITRGFGDVVYYTSSEGEKNVRSTVYHQVLEQLDKYLNEPEVQFHLIGQSLGVTLTHDFLYGLFNPDPNYKPDFIKQKQGRCEDQKRFEQWRQKAQNGQLKLGSLTSTASQLPLFVMRKQDLVDSLSKGQLLKAANIGIVEANKIKWKLFYDVDDLIGFASRRLYDSDNVIMDIQVDSDDNPAKAHTAYWENPTVIEETANLLLENVE